MDHFKKVSDGPVCCADTSWTTSRTYFEHRTV